RRPRGSPLHAAADDEAGRGRHDARELLRLLDPRGGRPARRRSREGQEEPRLTCTPPSRSWGVSRVARDVSLPAEAGFAGRRRKAARGVSEFEQLYREVILDHYKSPRNHGLLEPRDAVAEGQNPLCGDEVTVSVRFGAGD